MSENVTCQTFLKITLKFYFKEIFVSFVEIK
jgi:hypothetical protein